MTRFRTVLLGCAAAGLLFCRIASADDVESTHHESPPRAMWLWSTDAIGKAQTDAAARKAFFDFCAAPHGRSDARLSMLYLETYNEEPWPQFLADAHRRGMKVEYIVGDGKFGPDHLGWLKEMCAKAVRYNEGVKPQERFDGIHFDVEPGGRGKWSQKAYRELLGYARRLVDEHNAANSPHMTIAADIGAGWPREHDDTWPSYPAAMEFCDYVVCMAYRDSAARQVARAFEQGQPKAAKERDIGFWVGCETGGLSDPELRHVTYFEEGWQYLHEELAKLPAMFRDRDIEVAGLAIHFYEPYLRLPQGPRPKPTD